MAKTLNKSISDYMDAKSKVRQDKVRRNLAHNMDDETAKSFRLDKPLKESPKKRTRAEAIVEMDTAKNKKRLGVRSEFEGAIDLVRKHKSTHRSDYE